MPFQIPVMIYESDIEDAIRDWDHDTTLAFLLKVDLTVSDAGFTEKLIRSLTASLRGDLSDEDFQSMIRELGATK